MGGGGIKNSNEDIFITNLSYLEDVMIQIELQIFIGEIDTKLFETVNFKIFKTKDIQDTD